jgi:hypothetical protein
MKTETTMTLQPVRRSQHLIDPEALTWLFVCLPMLIARRRCPSTVTVYIQKTTFFLMDSSIVQLALC